MGSVKPINVYNGTQADAGMQAEALDLRERAVKFLRPGDSKAEAVGSILVGSILIWGSASGLRCPTATAKRRAERGAGRRAWLFGFAA